MTYAIVFICAGLLAYWAFSSARLMIEAVREHRAAELRERIAGKKVDADGR